MVEDCNVRSTVYPFNCNQVQIYIPGGNRFEAELFSDFNREGKPEYQSDIWLGNMQTLISHRTRLGLMIPTFAINIYEFLAHLRDNFKGETIKFECSQKVTKGSVITTEPITREWDFYIYDETKNPLPENATSMVGTGLIFPIKAYTVGMIPDWS